MSSCWERHQRAQHFVLKGHGGCYMSVLNPDPPRVLTIWCVPTKTVSAPNIAVQGGYVEEQMGAVRYLYNAETPFFWFFVRYVPSADSRPS